MGPTKGWGNVSDPATCTKLSCPVGPEVNVHVPVSGGRPGTVTVYCSVPDSVATSTVVLAGLASWNVVTVVVAALVVSLASWPVTGVGSTTAGKSGMESFPTVVDALVRMLIHASVPAVFGTFSSPV